MFYWIAPYVFSFINMFLSGYEKLTLIDYPGKLATVVFTIGCNFRCPFCHNPELVDLRLTHGKTSEDDFFEFLKKRKKILEGVCVTGGEPTIQPDIVEFIEKIKALGFLVKLDSNGTRPDVLKKLVDRKLVDYIAMDIKNSLEKYQDTVGTVSDIERIKLSVALIMRSGIEYEFRTTAVPGIHTEKDFEAIAQWIKGAKKYYLQEYREGKILDPSLKNKTKGKKLDLDKIKKNIEKWFGMVGVRR